jgi:hypothetical protein
MPAILPPARTVPGSPTNHYTCRWCFLSTMVSRSRICVYGFAWWEQAHPLRR